MYQRKVDVDMLNAVKNVLADVSSVSPLSDRGKHNKHITSIKYIEKLIAVHIFIVKKCSNLKQNLNIFRFLFLALLFEVIYKLVIARHLETITSLLDIYNRQTCTHKPITFDLKVFFKSPSSHSVGIGPIMLSEQIYLIISFVSGSPNLPPMHPHPYAPPSQPLIHKHNL